MIGRVKYLLISKKNNMKIISEKIKENTGIDNYWLRVYFTSDDGSQETKLLICASQEYIFNLFNTTEPEEIKIKQWFDGIVKKWELQGNDIFNKKIHYDAYANTPEGKERALAFLEKEVA